MCWHHFCTIPRIFHCGCGLNLNWNASEEDDSWDPDFAEFDLPKSKTKKPAGPKKKGAASDEDDFKLDDDFNEFDLFDEKNSGFDDDDDDF